MKFRANAKVMQGKNEIGRVTYTVKAKNKREARAKITRLMKARKPKRTKKNVEQGFWDATGFHSIRASKDYSKARTGEKFRERPKRSQATRGRRRR